MKAIRDMTSAEFYIFMAGGERRLRIREMCSARIARDKGDAASTRMYVAAARGYQRQTLDYLRRYRTAKAREQVAA